MHISEKKCHVDSKPEQLDQNCQTYYLQRHSINLARVNRKHRACQRILGSRTPLNMDIGSLSAREGCAYRPQITLGLLGPSLVPCLLWLMTIWPFTTGPLLLPPSPLLHAPPQLSLALRIWQMRSPIIQI